MFTTGKEWEKGSVKCFEKIFTVKYGWPESINIQQGEKQGLARRLLLYRSMTCLYRKQSQTK
jgi:hypothetical protein